MFRCLLSFLILAALGSFSQAQVCDIYPLQVIKLSDKVINISFSSLSVTAIFTSEGIVLVDTYRSPGVMRCIKNRIEKEFGQSDYKYVINTHGHWDHTGGNGLFTGTKIVAQENAAKYMSISPPVSPGSIWYAKKHLAQLEEELEYLSNESKEAKELKEQIAAWKDVNEYLADSPTNTLPTKTFSEKLVLNSGGLTIELYNCGNLHTNHDVLIYIPEESILITGDIFNSKSSLSFQINKIMNVPELISLLKTILNRDPGLKYVVTSHGGIFPGSDLYETIEYLDERYADLDEKLSAAEYLMIQVEKHDIETAMADYRKELSEQPEKYYKSEDEFNTLAEMLINKATVDKAISVLELTVRQFPTSGLTYDNLGGVYLKKGDIKNAIKYYEKSLELFPQNRHASEVIKILKSKIAE